MSSFHYLFSYVSCISSYLLTYNSVMVQGFKKGNPPLGPLDMKGNAGLGRMIPLLGGHQNGRIDTGS